MKKTLERLKKDAIERVGKYLTSAKEVDEKVKGKKVYLSKTAINLVRNANVALEYIIRYIMSLEDYSLELDEEWDKLLKRVEEPQQTAQKEKSKKKPYIS